MHVPGMTRRRWGRMQLAMTPMIDIVFNLLVFFLLMPSFEATRGYLPTNLPATSSGHVRPAEQAIRIRLAAGGSGAAARIELGRREVAGYAELRRKLRETAGRLGRKAGRVPVVISPDATVWHRDVTAAFDSAVDAGLRNIQFAVPR